MESPDLGATPIGWTELLAGTVATLFALASTWGLLTVMATAPGLAEARQQADLAAALRAAPVADACAGGPALGGMRLGKSRIYGQAGIRLEPVPLAVTPAVSARDAYRKAAPRAPGCQTEEILAYYSSLDSPLARTLAWAVVSASPCGSRRCVTVSPVDATSGLALPPASFPVQAGR